MAVRAAQRGLQALEVEESSNAESLAQHEAVDLRCARHIPSNKSKAAVLAVGMLPIKIESLTTEPAHNLVYAVYFTAISWHGNVLLSLTMSLKVKASDYVIPASSNVQKQGP